MKSASFVQKLLASAVLLAASVTASATDVGVSISIGQPGFYGQLDIGDFPYPQPRLIYRNPIVVYPVAGVIYEPLYLRVPPGHYKNWRRYCGRYDACGRPVYFVQDRWYEREYVPIYRERHGWRDDDDRGRGGDWDRGGRNGYSGKGNKGKGNKGKGRD